MKKIIIFLLLVLSVCVFGKTEAQYKPYLNLKSEANRNPNVNSLVFSGQMEENGKVVSIYKKMEILFMFMELKEKNQK